MSVPIFIDESGYTGEHQLNEEQPIFVLSSINLDAEATAEIRAKHFAEVQSAELKHSRLAKRPNGRQRIVDFVRDLASKNSAAGAPVATAFAAHKRFQLLMLITDLWVEPAMHQDGIEMYERGGNVAFSNMSFYVLGLAPQFLDQLLQLFEPMMRLRTREAYKSFWDFVYRKFHNPAEISPDPQVQKMIRDTIVCFMGGQDRLGPPHLLGLPEHCLDVAFSTVAVTAHHWQNRISEPLRFVLDESKYFAQAKWIWEEMTRSDMPKATFHGSANVRIEFPLNIEGTTTADSKVVHQLQLADLVAGAVAEFCANQAGVSKRPDYAKALEDAGVRSLIIGGIWPTPEVTPEEMGTSQMTGEYLDYLAAQLKKP